jgi:glycine hydroxymethyltransferase
VRTAAGLFDVSHMSAFEVGGPHALGFLELLLANRASRLAPGEAQYSSALYPDGTHIDDLYVYRLDRERFMLVLNAANAERVMDWAAAVNSRRFAIDEEMPAKEIDAPVRLRDLRNAGDESLIGLAFQGPASSAVLRKLADKPSERVLLDRLIQNEFATVRLAGLKALVARTGYTGEKTGFEIYLHPTDAEKFWNAVLTAGRPLGVLPAGLGARDSTRVEAGFPLFGHDLEGELGISMTEAGYGFVARFHQPFFIGRAPYMERARRSRRHILRLRGQGRKTLRAGHAILDESGRAVGRVTSFAYAHEDMTFIVLACVEEPFQPAPGSLVRGARAAVGESSSPPDERSLVELRALTRFPDDEERSAWPARYAKPASKPVAK